MDATNYDLQHKVEVFINHYLRKIQNRKPWSTTSSEVGHINILQQLKRKRMKTTRAFSYIPTYIQKYTHNWSLQTFSQENDLASHTTYGVCVNLKSTPSDSFLRNLWWQFYLLPSVFLSDEATVEIFLPYFSFDVWPDVWIMALFLLSQDTTTREIGSIFDITSRQLRLLT